MTEPTSDLTPHEQWRQDSIANAEKQTDTPAEPVTTPTVEPAEPEQPEQAPSQ